jgi:hypothetical protein
MSTLQQRKRCFQPLLSFLHSPFCLHGRKGERHNCLIALHPFSAALRLLADLVAIARRESQSLNSFTMAQSTQTKLTLARREFHDGHSIKVDWELPRWSVSNAQAHRAAPSNKITQNLAVANAAQPLYAKPLTCTIRLVFGRGWWRGVWMKEERASTFNRRTCCQSWGQRLGVWVRHKRLQR